MSEAEASVGGNEDALLYNMTASLSCVCAILCAISAAGMAAHSIYILTQASGFTFIHVVKWWRWYHIGLEKLHSK